MLSKAALLLVQRPIFVLTTRSSGSGGGGSCSISPKPCSESCPTPKPSACPQPPPCKAGGSDSSSPPTVPRPVRGEQQPKVQLGFLPDEWFQFFYKKTGVTGPYMLGVAILTYICSKEIYVMEHEYYNGLSLAVMSTIAVKKLGPGIAKYCDGEIERVEKDMNEVREGELKDLQDLIDDEKKEQWRAEGSRLLMDAKKENIDLQLEIAFRERELLVYEEVKRRLDYQVECRNVLGRMNQKNMVNWIVRSSCETLQDHEQEMNLSALAVRAK